MTQTQRKAMEQALKALEWGCNDLLQGRNAADALRAALAEPQGESDTVVCPVCQGQGCVYQGCESWIHCSNCNTTGKIYTAPQPAEPVAWRDPTNSDPGQGCTYDKAKQEKWPHIYTQPLYTSTPASKPWVGLTDEEIEEINVSFTGRRDLARMFARAIEAKLRERGA